jgi:hypothetical protein
MTVRESNPETTKALAASGQEAAGCPSFTSETTSPKVIRKTLDPGTRSMPMGQKLARVLRGYQLLKSAARPAEDSTYLGRWLGLHALASQEFINHADAGAAVRLPFMAASTGMNLLTPGLGAVSTALMSPVAAATTIPKDPRELHRTFREARKRRKHKGSFQYGMSKVPGWAYGLYGLTGLAGGALVNKYLRTHGMAQSNPGNREMFAGLTADDLPLALASGALAMGLPALTYGAGSALNDTIMSRVSKDTERWVADNMADTRTQLTTGLPFGKILAAR